MLILRGIAGRNNTDTEMDNVRYRGHVYSIRIKDMHDKAVMDT